MRDLIWLLIRSILEPLFWIILFCLPLIVVFWLMLRSKRAYDSEAKVPFSDLPLRPPGESSRIAAGKIFEKVVEGLLLIAAACVVFGMSTAASPPERQLLTAGMGGVFVLGTTAITAPRILRALRKYRNYQLGFRGERLVGEELNQLLAHGYRVFHDVPFESFNVDHIAVGPAGVFVVETKTRRKWKTKALKHAPHMVYYDGHSLTWPSGNSDRFGLDQTQANARTVSEWLTEVTGQPVLCRAILTLPGWWVERKTKERSPVSVLSSKKLHRYFPTRAANPIFAEQLRRIHYHLGERCRMAEPDGDKT